MMLPLPRPRGFLDYALFALMLTCALELMFWVNSVSGIGWRDAVLAVVVAVMTVFLIILVRRGEKARWIASPNWKVNALMTLGAFVWMFGAFYADALLLHRQGITFKELRSDIVTAIVSIGMMWSSRKQLTAKYPNTKP